MMPYIWGGARIVCGQALTVFCPFPCVHASLCFCRTPLPSASLTPGSHKGATDYLLVGHCPEANEEEEATLTDIIITVLLGSARGPFCGVITVLSSTHHCIRHDFTHLQHPFVCLRAAPKHELYSISLIKGSHLLFSVLLFGDRLSL